MVALAVAPQPCSVTYCAHTLTVGVGRTAWETRNRFPSLSRLDGYIGKRQLDYSNNGCVSYLSGYGVLVKVDACGKGAQRLRFTATSLRNASVAVKIVYG